MLVVHFHLDGKLLEIVTKLGGRSLHVPDALHTHLVDCVKQLGLQSVQHHSIFGQHNIHSLSLIMNILLREGA